MSETPPALIPPEPDARSYEIRAIYDDLKYLTWDTGRHIVDACLARNVERLAALVRETQPAATWQEYGLLTPKGKLLWTGSLNRQWEDKPLLPPSIFTTEAQAREWITDTTNHFRVQQTDPNYRFVRLTTIAEFLDVMPKEITPPIVAESVVE